MDLRERLSTVVICAVTVVAVAAMTFAQEEATYVSNKQCKICHNSKAEGEIWNKWKAMDHAKAYQTLLGDKAKALAQKRGLTVPPAESPECLRCHVTGYDATKEPKVPDSILKEDGVQCESCHGKASVHMADGKKFKTTKDPSIKMGAHITRGDETVCKTCHNDQSPSWDPQRYTLGDGTKVGFDYKQAWAKIVHEKPKEQQGAAGATGTSS